MIEKTKEDLQREFDQLFSFQLDNEQLLQKKVVAFEISQAQYNLLADLAARREIAMQALLPDKYPPRTLSDDALVADVYECALRRALDLQYKATDMLEDLVTKLD